MHTLQTSADVFTDRLRRARELCEVYPHAAEMLAFFAGVCEVQASAFVAARQDPPGQADLAAFLADQVLPGIIESALADGPEQLRTAVLARFHEGDLPELAERWLRQESMTPADSFLVRAAAQPVFEAIPGLAAATGSVAGDERHCPTCGGLPQLSCFSLSAEALVTGPRLLLCSRCLGTWIYPRLCCAGCGSTESSRLPIFSDAEHFAHLRIDACDVCRQYLVTVEMAKDVSAVPVVDEIAALPLDLYARERGFTKLTPNLMGF